MAAAWEALVTSTFRGCRPGNDDLQHHFLDPTGSDHTPVCIPGDIQRKLQSFDLQWPLSMFRVRRDESNIDTGCYSAVTASSTHCRASIQHFVPQTTGASVHDLVAEFIALSLCSRSNMCSSQALCQLAKCFRLASRLDESWAGQGTRSSIVYAHVQNFLKKCSWRFLLQVCSLPQPMRPVTHRTSSLGMLRAGHQTRQHLHQHTTDWSHLQSCETNNNNDLYVKGQRHRLLDVAVALSHVTPRMAVLHSSRVYPRLISPNVSPSSDMSINSA